MIGYIENISSYLFIIIASWNIYFSLVSPSHAGVSDCLTLSLRPIPAGNPSLDVLHTCL